VQDSIIEENGKSSSCKEKDHFCNGIKIGGGYEVQLTLIDSILRKNADWGLAAWVDDCGRGLGSFTGQVIFKEMELENISDNNISGNQDGMGNPGGHPWNRPDVPDGQVCLP